MNLVPPITKMFLESAAAAAETCTLAPLGCHDDLLFCQTKLHVPQPYISYISG
jgi:hypothetical protein